MKKIKIDELEFIVISDLNADDVVDEFSNNKDLYEDLYHIVVRTEHDTENTNIIMMGDAVGVWNMYSSYVSVFDIIEDEGFSEEYESSYNYRIQYVNHIKDGLDIIHNIVLIVRNDVK